MQLRAKVFGLKSIIIIDPITQESGLGFFNARLKWALSTLILLQSAEDRKIIQNINEPISFYIRYFNLKNS